VATGDAVQLERAKQLLPRLAAAPSRAAAEGGSAAPDEQHIERIVIDAVEGHVIRQLSDFTAAFPQGTSRMRGLIDVMRAAVHCRAPGEGITRVGCCPFPFPLCSRKHCTCQGGLLFICSLPVLLQALHFLPAILHGAGSTHLIWHVPTATSEHA
jgi:hypothetical protein